MFPTTIFQSCWDGASDTCVFQCCKVLMCLAGVLLAINNGYIMLLAFSIHLI